MHQTYGFRFPPNWPNPWNVNISIRQPHSTVSKVSTSLGYELVAEIAEDVVQRRIVGRVDFVFSYNNPYVKTALTTNTVTLHTSRFYTQISGEGTFSGESNGEMRVLDMSGQTEYLFMPTIAESPIKGSATQHTRDYRGHTTKRSYTFELNKVEENHIGRIEINVVHPDDEMGTMFITGRAYAERQHGYILQDDEPHTLYTDKSLRNFNTSRPLQLSVTSDGQLHSRGCLLTAQPQQRSGKSAHTLRGR